jgi:hypothetical protein
MDLDELIKHANDSQKREAYTEDDMRRMLEGYIRVPPDMYDKIPKAAHIRYVKKGEGPIETRFVSGGFVKFRWTDDETGDRKINIENRIGGRKGVDGYVSFYVNLTNVDRIYKKYDYHSFIEITLLNNTLHDMARQIQELKKRIEALE